MLEISRHHNATEHNATVEKIRAATAVIPDFPIKGITFIDITTVLKRPQVNMLAFNAVQELFDSSEYDLIVSPEARGWLLGQPLALSLEKPFIPIRKPHKLPREIQRCPKLDSEYEEVNLEVHLFDIPPDSRILFVDDVLASNGTALAVTQLIHNLGAEVVGVAALYDLQYLDKVTLPCPARAVVPYETPPAPYMPDDE